MRQAPLARAAEKGGAAIGPARVASKASAARPSGVSTMTL
jgi:hypothetical protein